MTFFFLSSGLFLGWSLGANDAANVFGSAVGTRMVSFKRAAIIASIFVILGAVIQGAGATHTLGKLGSVSAIGGAFTVALSAALTVYWMTKFKIPVSTSQAIVGAIIGWNFYTGLPTDYTVLSKIISTWIMGPILGAVFAIILYYIQHIYFKIAKIHLLKQDAYIRFALLLVGAFGSFSLGANNIANVMGVFVSAAPENYLNFGLFKLSGVQQLFLLGGIAIAVGIFTYSKRVMDTVGNGLMQLSSKSAIITVLSHSMVLFVFSSTGLSNFVQSLGLPPIPLVPVSSSQVIVGSILGLGLLKGGYNINYKILGGIGLGWIATPLIAGVLSFFALFFVNNVFLIPVSNNDSRSNITNRILEKNSKVIQKDTKSLSIPVIDSVKKDSVNNIVDSSMLESVDSPVSENRKEYFDKLEIKSDKKDNNISKYFNLALLIGILAGIIFLISRWLNSLYKRNKLILSKNSQILEAQKALAEIETKYQLLENKQMEDQLNYKNRELTTMALNLIEKNNFLELLKSKIEEIKLETNDTVIIKKLNNLYLLISQNQNLENDREAFQMHVDELNKDFFYKLNSVYPDLTKNEKRLCVYLRLNMSSKEIAALTNISPKSVEMNRYRLRKKMNIGRDEQLVKVLQNL
jgi:phosphate/sulfate permease/DNA-binding CsgD family transcriptional regulator